MTSTVDFGGITMGDLASIPAIQTYAACVAVLTVKMILSAAYTGVMRQRCSGFVNPEDARVFGGGAEAAPIEHPEVARGLRIQRNDSENIPIFFAVGLAYVATVATPTGAAIYCWTYTFARLGHTIAYMLGAQPWRALLFFVGVFAQLGMALQILI